MNHQSKFWIGVVAVLGASLAAQKFVTNGYKALGTDDMIKGVAKKLGLLSDRTFDYGDMQPSYHHTV